METSSKNFSIVLGWRNIIIIIIKKKKKKKKKTLLP